MSPPLHRSVESEESATDERTRPFSLVAFVAFVAFVFVFVSSFSLGAPSSRRSLLASNGEDEKRALSFEIQWEARAWPPAVGKRARGSVVVVVVVVVVLLLLLL